MATTIVGADADELERAASHLRLSADDLDAHGSSLTTILRSVAWIGGVATRFLANWNGIARPRLSATSSFLRQAAATLEQNARDQRAVSAHTPAEPIDFIDAAPTVADEPLGLIEGVLDGLGEALSVGEWLAHAAPSLAQIGLDDDLIDFITSSKLIDALNMLDRGVDVGGVLVNFVQDLVQHPGLAADERIVHALADAALRFGVSEGIDQGVTWLTSAIGTTVLPGLGTVAGSMIGHVVGMAAETVIGDAVDALDDATDVIDHAANLVVDGFAALKSTLGIVVDIAAGAIDAGQAVLSGTIGGVDDAAGAVLDAGKWLVGA